MGLSCTCPITTLPTLENVDCPIDFDQVVRLGLTLSKATPDFTATVGEEITNETAWTTKLASATETKLQLTPALANLVIPSSEGAFIGGNDNSTVDGMRYYVGEDNITITAEIHSSPQSAILAMDELSCLSDATLGGSRLTMFPMTRQIRGKSYVLGVAGVTAGDYSGIPIYNFRVSTVGAEGYNSKNKYMVSFDVKANDMRDFVATQVDFSPFALANV